MYVRTGYVDVSMSRLASLRLLLLLLRVEKLAMPFATNVQQILKAKLGVDSKMGATYGKAYCGVVGGLDRHEYAVLGPSVSTPSFQSLQPVQIVLKPSTSLHVNR